MPQKDDHVFLLRASVREDGCIAGTVHRFGLKTEDMSFAGLDSVFLTMNDWMDSEDPPEISAELRSFKDGRRAVAALRVWTSRDAPGRPGEEPPAGRRLSWCGSFTASIPAGRARSAGRVRDCISEVRWN